MTSSISDKNHASDSNDALVAQVWQQYVAQCPTQKSSDAKIKEIILGRGKICPECESTDWVSTLNPRVLVCADCGTESRLTAGTFFSHVKKTRHWLGIIWLLDHGAIINASQYAKLAGIAYATAHSVFRKISMVIEMNMGDDFTEIPSAHFIGLFRKRSRVTPAGKHPASEEDEIVKQLKINQLHREPQKDISENHTPENVSAMQHDSIEAEQEVQSSLRQGDAEEPWDPVETEPAKLSGLAKEVYEILSQTPIKFDDLVDQTKRSAGDLSSTLCLLEITGLARSQGIGQYVRSLPPKIGRESVPIAEEAMAAVSAFCEFILSNGKGISRKYLQHYLANYWFQIDRVHWKAKSLLEACVRSRAISYAEILAYVSAPIVKIFLPRQPEGLAA